MTKQFGIFFFLLCTMFGCTKPSSEYTSRFFDDGQAKPTIAFIPVFDTSDARLSWSLSEEFTYSIKERLAKKNNLYLSPIEETNLLSQTLTEQNNPFSSETHWVKETFGNYEFVVFTEMIEHDIHPKEVADTLLDRFISYSELSMSMRVRIFDLRSGDPEVILQEIIQQDHLIPTPSNLDKESPDRFTKIAFYLSPLGLAHSQLSKEVAKRVEDYVFLSKSP